MILKIWDCASSFHTSCASARTHTHTPRDTHQPALRDGRVADERGEQAGGLLHGHAAPLSRHRARRAVRHARGQRSEPHVHLHNTSNIWANNHI